MKPLLEILILLFAVSIYSVPIEDELNTIYTELQSVFNISPGFVTEILPGEGRSFAEISDDSGSYKIKIFEDSYSHLLGRHELAHIFLFDLIKRNGNFPDMVPVWYHEFVAIWFQNLNQWAESSNSMSSFFFDFTSYNVQYPGDEDLVFFYDSIGSFTGYISKQEDFGKLVTGVTESYLNGKSMEESFKTITGSGLSFLIIKWKLLGIFPYFIIITLIIVFIYFIARGSGGIGKNFDES